MTAMHQLILATRAENADLRGGAAWGWDVMGFHGISWDVWWIFGGWVH